MYRRLSAAPRASLKYPLASLALSRRGTGNIPSTSTEHHVRGTMARLSSAARSRVLGAAHTASPVLSARPWCGAWRMGGEAMLRRDGTQRRTFFSFLNRFLKTEDPAPPEDGGDAAKEKLPVSALSPHAVEQGKVEDKLREIRQLYLEPYDKTYGFLQPLKNTAPMVMMLGNHSSGKSTLINFLAGREIQETGIAPTDDGFTVIRRDAFDLDTDGASTVSNPQYQYQPLQQFGMSFVTHFKMKARKMGDTSQIPLNMVLVDSPGMIDTPLHSSPASSANGIFGGDHTRGYDFLGATRWFAQQSDVILLMFDPANPGTTGETLDVLTKSLAGLEHKFLLVMNKADVFEKVTDFGRAYGTLCWNLSKVMKMKDIPRVYTTCTPLLDPTKNPTTPKPRAVSGTVPEEELSRQRNEIVREIMSAPIRRMDNLITETENGARNLLLALRAARVLRQDYRQKELAVFSTFASACLVPPVAAVFASSMSITATILLTLLSIAVAGGGFLASQSKLKEVELQLLKSSDYVLDRLYTSRTRTKDVEERWHLTVKPEIVRLATSYHNNKINGITALPICSARAGREIEMLLEEYIPVMRSSVAEYKDSYFRGQN